MVNLLQRPVGSLPRRGATCSAAFGLTTQRANNSVVPDYSARLPLVGPRPCDLWPDLGVACPGNLNSPVLPGYRGRCLILGGTAQWSQQSGTPGWGMSGFEPGNSVSARQGKMGATIDSTQRASPTAFRRDELAGTSRVASLGDRCRRESNYCGLLRAVRCILVRRRLCVRLRS